MTAATAKKTTHGRHKTTHVVHGKAGRRRAAHRPAPGPSDPPKPANANYVPINRDPRHGAEFEYQWSPGACFNPQCTQRHIAIRSPPNWASLPVPAPPKRRCKPWPPRICCEKRRAFWTLLPKYCQRLVRPTSGRFAAPASPAC